MSYKVSEIEVIYRPKKGKRPKLTCSKDVYKLLCEIYDWNTIEHHETFWIILLNRGSRVIGTYKVSEGGNSATIVDAKMVFQVALKANATAIILSHCHPSGSLKPSKADIDLTTKLKKGGELLDILVLDHLILTPEKGEFFSFSDEGYM